MTNKLIVPQTIDELLDICATIVRNTGGRYSAETLAELFPVGYRNQARQLVVFNNAGDMPFTIWVDGQGRAILDHLLKSQPSYLYAYRKLVRGKVKETIFRYPAWDSKGGWLHWIKVDADLYPDHTLTQFT